MGLKMAFFHPKLKTFTDGTKRVGQKCENALWCYSHNEYRIVRSEQGGKKSERIAAKNS